MVDETEARRARTLARIAEIVPAIEDGAAR
jgi:hypothetical protein